METKICTKCCVNKPLIEYHNDKYQKDGLRSICKQCTCNIRKEYVKNNLDKVKEDNRYWFKVNPEKAKENATKWIKANPDKVKKSKDKWVKANSEKISEKNKKYDKNNPERVAWKGVLRNCLIRMNKNKEGHTIDLLGYSALELKQHLESLFTDGMSWGNHGQWHIDHIQRVCEFEKDTHPSIVNALSNLRPLWATTREINGIIYEGNLNRG